MSFSFKNIFVVVICLMLVGLGYYLMTDTSGVAATMSSNETVRQELINKTQAFIVRSVQLQKINIDQSFFTDSTFTSLRSYSTAIQEQIVGRDDIFGEVSLMSESPVRSDDNATEIP